MLLIYNLISMNNSVLSKWRSIQTDDQILNKELSLSDDKLKDAFTNKMEFGTAGIRGLMGAGTNKMNVHTVAAATQAYASFLKKNKTLASKGIVIGHDNRHNAKVFSLTVARVMQANGIKTYIFENNELQPTPLVSYVIRDMKLAGGIIITASHNPKEYNGFKVYDNLGGQLLPKHTEAIGSAMAKIDLLNVKQKDWKELYVKQSVIDSYKKKVLDVRLNKDISTDLKVVFSAQHGTAAKLIPQLLDEMKINYSVVEKQQTPDPDFSFTKVPNPEDGRAFKRAEKLARKNKSHLIVTTDPDADRLGVAVKYKKRWKFLNGNQTAALYLDYRLRELKEQKKLPKNGYIVTTVVSGELAKKVASKYGLKVYTTHVGFKNIAALIESKKKEIFIFGYEESYGFLIDPSIARDKDALQAMVGIVDMANTYRKEGTDMYSRLLEMFDEYGIHRSTQIGKQVNNSVRDTLLKKLAKLKTFSEQKVIEVQDYRKGYKGLDAQNLVKVILKSGSSIAIRPSGTEPKVKVYVNLVGGKGEKLLDIISFEKEVAEWVNDNSEVFEDKKVTPKVILKYSIFLSIIVGIMFFVFHFIYKTSVSASGSGAGVWTVAQAAFNLQTSWLWLLLWFWMVAQNFLGAWMKKRMFDRLGEKVKPRHLVVSAIMGSFIAFVTPFAIGGDAVGYWYLRRKGIKRGPLLATMASSTLWGETKFALQTTIMVGIGWEVYKDIFASGDVQAQAAMIWFFVGLSWSFFAAFMIMMLTLNRPMQEFIVRNSVSLLEWTRFYHMYNPEAKEAAVQYQFKQIRGGMRKIWNTWWFVLEMMFYDLLPLFFDPGTLMLVQMNAINPGNKLGGYWTNIVINDIVGTANSMSLTPGGSGTAEWLRVVTSHTLYKDSALIHDPSVSHYFNGGNKLDGYRMIASGADLNWKIIYGWPWLGVSLLMILNIISVERNSLTTKQRTTRKWFWGTIWLLAIIGYVLLMTIGYGG